MPYLVTCPENQSVTVLKALSANKTPEGTITDYNHEAHIYVRGQVIEDDDVSPVVKKAYDDGEDHVCSILKKVSEGEAGDLREEAPTPPTLGVTTNETASPGTLNPAKAAEDAEAEAAAAEVEKQLKAAKSEEKKTAPEAKKGG